MLNFSLIYFIDNLLSLVLMTNIFYLIPLAFPLALSSPLLLRLNFSVVLFSICRSGKKEARLLSWYWINCIFFIYKLKKTKRLKILYWIFETLSTVLLMHSMWVVKFWITSGNNTEASSLLRCVKTSNCSNIWYQTEIIGTRILYHTPVSYLECRKHFRWSTAVETWSSKNELRASTAGIWIFSSWFGWLNLIGVVWNRIPGTKKVLLRSNFFVK